MEDLGDKFYEGGERLSETYVEKVCNLLGNPLFPYEAKIDFLVMLSPEDLGRVFMKLLKESKKGVLKDSLELMLKESKKIKESKEIEESRKRELENSLELIDDKKLFDVLYLCDRELGRSILDVLDLYTLRKMFRAFGGNVKMKRNELNDAKVKRVEEKIEETKVNLEKLLKLRTGLFGNFYRHTKQGIIASAEKYLENVKKQSDYGRLGDIYNLVNGTNKDILKILSHESENSKGLYDEFETIDHEFGSIDDLLFCLEEIGKYSDGVENLFEGMFIEPSQDENYLNKFKLLEKTTLELLILSIIKNDNIPVYKYLIILRECFVKVMMQGYELYLDELFGGGLDKENITLIRKGVRYEGKDCRKNLDNELHKEYKGVKRLLSSSNNRAEIIKDFKDEIKNDENIQKEFGEIFEGELKKALKEFKDGENVYKFFVGNLLLTMVSYRFEEILKKFIEYVENKYVVEFEKKQGRKTQSDILRQPDISKQETGKPRKIGDNNSIDLTSESDEVVDWEKEHSEESEKLDKILNTLTVNDDVRKRIKKYIVKAKLNKGNIDENTLKNCMKKFNVKLPIGDVICIFEGGEETPESKGLEQKPVELKSKPEELKSKPEELKSESEELKSQDNSSEKINLEKLVNELIELLKKSYEIENEKSLRKQFEDYGDIYKLQKLKNNLEGNNGELRSLCKLNDLDARKWPAKRGKNPYRFILVPGIEKQFKVTFFGNHKKYEEELWIMLGRK